MMKENLYRMLKFGKQEVVCQGQVHEAEVAVVQTGFTIAIKKTCRQQNQLLHPACDWVKSSSKASFPIREFFGVVYISIFI